MSGEFLLISGEGQTYSEHEADEWLKLTEWRKLQRKPLPGPISLIVAEAILVSVVAELNDSGYTAGLAGAN